MRLSGQQLPELRLQQQQLRIFFHYEKLLGFHFLETPGNTASDLGCCRPTARNASRGADAATDAKIRYIWNLVVCAKGRSNRAPVKADNKSRVVLASDSPAPIGGMTWSSGRSN